MAIAVSLERPLQLMFGRRDRAGLDCFLALCDYPVRRLLHHLLQQQSQMRIWPVIRRGDVLDAIGVG